MAFCCQESKLTEVVHRVQEEKNENDLVNDNEPWGHMIKVTRWHRRVIFVSDEANFTKLLCGD